MGAQVELTVEGLLSKVLLHSLLILLPEDVFQKVKVKPPVLIKQRESKLLDAPSPASYWSRQLPREEGYIFIRCGISCRERELWVANIFDNLPQLTFCLRQWLALQCTKRTHVCLNSHSMIESAPSMGYHHYNVAPSALLLDTAFQRLLWEEALSSLD